MGYTGEPANIFNPITLFAAYAYQINSLTYESLLQWDQHLNLVGDLATGYTVSADGLTYTFNLRHNVTWSDGVPFTAHDVEFTIDVTLNQSFSEGFFYGPLAMSSGGTTPTGLTLNKTMVSIPDNYTIVFHLTTPYSPFLLYVSSLPTLAQHVLQGQDLSNNNYINNHIVGTGPFIVTQYVVGDHITMEANPNYWGGRPHLNSITFKVFQDQTSAELALRSGEVSYIEAVPPQDVAGLNSTPGIVVKTEPSWNLEYMGYNFNTNLTNGQFNPISIKDVRQAIAEAVNVSQVVQAGYMGYATPVNQFMIPFFNLDGHSLYNNSIPTTPYNPTDADRLLNQSGYPWTAAGGNVSNGAPYRFQINTIISAGNGQELTMLQAIQSMLSNVGIDLVIKIEEEATATADIAGAAQPKTWNLFGPTHISESPDPDFMASLFYNTPATVGPYGSDWGNYNNSQVNQLYLAAEATVNNTQRAQIYQKIGGILASDYAWLWLDNPQEIIAWNTNFHGFVLGPEGISAGVQGALSPYSLMNVTYSGGGTTSTTSTTSQTTSSSSGGGTTSTTTTTSPTGPASSNSTLLYAGVAIVIIIVAALAIFMMRRRS
ncbi:MAG: ABC transporter substrate-binding protein [Thaumarchaeota archaeon]|nr:ABC transporter substrate-binding protein [Nitrososphaerota archaeon]